MNDREAMMSEQDRVFYDEECGCRQTLDTLESMS